MAEYWKPFRPPGLVGDLADFIYCHSIFPSFQVSCAAALAFMSGICGRQFQTPTLSGLIQWIVILAGTGEGKEDGTAGIQALFTQMYDYFGDSINRFSGPSKFASDKAILVRLNESPCFVSTIGEVGLWLQGLNNSHNPWDTALKATLLDVFGKSGMNQMIFAHINAKKENSTLATRSPAVTLYCDSTPDNFFKALTEADIESGLVTRFTPVPIPEPDIDSYNPNARKHQLPPKVKDTLRDLIALVLKNEKENKYVIVAETPAANQWQEKYALDIRRRIRENKDSAIEKIWTRAHLRLMRIGCSLAIGRNPTEPKVERSDYEWASIFINTGNYYFTERFTNGVTGDNSNRYNQQVEMKKELHKYVHSEWNEATQKKYERVNHEMWKVKAIPRATLQALVGTKYCFRKDNDPPGAFNHLVRECELNGLLVKVDPVRCKQWGKTGEVYEVKDHSVDNGLQHFSTP